MNIREKIEKVIAYSVFICYVILLIKILFLSRVSFLELFNGEREVGRLVNIIPFYSIFEYLFGGSMAVKRFAWGNVAGNIIIFIPLGAFLPLVRSDKRIRANLLYILIASLSVEIIQWIFAIGTADIDDLILNSFGGFIGILGYKLLLFVIKDEKKLHTLAAVLSILALPVIYYYLFMIKMRF